MFTWNESRLEAAAEIEALAKELGVSLPMAVEQILWLEEQGATVDLVTGEITLDGANERVTVIEAALELLATEVV